MADPTSPGSPKESIDKQSAGELYALSPDGSRAAAAVEDMHHHEKEALAHATRLMRHSIELIDEVGELR